MSALAILYTTSQMAVAVWFSREYGSDVRAEESGTGVVVDVVSERNEKEISNTSIYSLLARMPLEEELTAHCPFFFWF